MISLIDDLLIFLRGHPLVEGVRVIEYDETPAGKLEAKIRCRFSRIYQFQIWLHIEPEFQDYAHQLFTDKPLLRWDNTPYYPDIPTAPHHFHNEHGGVSISLLEGKPMEDLKKVLAEIEKWLSTLT